MKRILALAIPLFIAACAAISPGCLDTTRDVTFTVYTYNNATPPAPIADVTIFISNTEISTTEVFGERYGGQTDSNGLLIFTRNVECGAEIGLSALQNNYKTAYANSIDGDFSCDHPTYTFYLEPE